MIEHSNVSFILLWNWQMLINKSPMHRVFLQFLSTFLLKVKQRSANYTQRILFFQQKSSIKNDCIILMKIKIDNEIVNRRLHDYMQ